MVELQNIYRPSLALLADQYEFTMAYGYWKAGLRAREAVFHLSFREQPFRGGFTIACGLQQVIQYLQNLKFTREDLNYLASLGGNDGKPLFEPAFLNYLFTTPFSCDLDAVPEGTIVFPQEPLIRVRGPIIQCQLVETALLNAINFQSLIATKAARIVLAAGNDPVLEFGLRRAQGIDGGLSASRAAYIGGCAATSNLLAGRLYGIPVKGTHAHSWVMCFEDELEAFSQYANTLPNNCIFLVDTYDTLEGVKNAIIVGERLRKNGHEMLGIRLDSGDLAWLSIEARKLLDAAGFQNTSILASNDLDEHLIKSLKDQGAKINLWCVGTRLVTAYDQPALGGVYKLSAVRDPGDYWRYRLKRSEQAIKVSNPGILQVRRYRQQREYLGDMIFDSENPPEKNSKMIDPFNQARRKTFAAATEYNDLLLPIFRQGKLVYDLPGIDAIRNRARKGLKMFHAGIKRILNPHEYPVGLEASLHRRRFELLKQER